MLYLETSSKLAIGVQNVDIVGSNIILSQSNNGAAQTDITVMIG